MKHRTKKWARGWSRRASSSDFHPTSKPDYKVRQLCRQIERALTAALSGCADAVLRDLAVDSVEPAPDATRLRVNVYPVTLPLEQVLTEAAGRLERVRGLLRSEVAAAITRKRAPELVFHLLDPRYREEVPS